MIIELLLSWTEDTVLRKKKTDTVSPSLGLQLRGFKKKDHYSNNRTHNCMIKRYNRHSEGKLNGVAKVHRDTRPGLGMSEDFPEKPLFGWRSER